MTAQTLREREGPQDSRIIKRVSFRLIELHFYGRDLGVTTLICVGRPLIIEFQRPSDQLYTLWAQLITF